MNHSIYCSSTSLKIVTGDADAKSIRIRKYAEIPLPAGAMINGIITDEEAMTRFFAQVNHDHALRKDPALLVINNNNIQVKSIEAPQVSEDLILDFIRREYRQYNDSENNVYDYVVLSPKGPTGGMQILAVGVARELLQSYRSALVKAGFNLTRINIGLNAQIKLAKFLPQLREGSVILVLIDGRALSLTLFEHGNYVITNRYRFTRADDDPGITEEIGGNISSMIQFSKTQRNSEAVTAAFVAGVSGAQVDVLRYSLTHLDIDILPLDMSEQIRLTGDAAEASDAGFDAGRYLLNLGNLLK